MLLTISLALAQDATSGGEAPNINVQTFRPALDGHEFFRMVDAELPAPGFTGRAVISHTGSPLQYTPEGGEPVDIVSEVLQLDAGLAYTKDRFRIGLDLPVVLGADGDGVEAGAGLGDMIIDAKFRFIDGWEGPIGVALGAHTSLPSSTIDGGLKTGGLGVGGALSVDKRLAALHLGASVGLDYVPAVELENVAWGSQGIFQLGAAYALNQRVGLVTELYASGVLDDIANPAARPTEWLAGGWVRTGKGNAIAVRPAVSFGIGDAVSTPSRRFLFTIAYDPVAPPDKDKDGIADKLDACPEKPEDLDGAEDTDGCPEWARLTINVVDTDGQPADEYWAITGTDKTGPSGAMVELDRGTIEIGAGASKLNFDVPGAGSVATTVTVPAPRGTLNVSIVDAKKAPVTGATFSARGPTTVKDQAAGSVSVRPGGYQLVAHAPGYRPGKALVEVAKDGSASITLEMLPAKAELKAEKIEIKDSIYFETGKAVIKAESFGLLDEVAEILRDHPEIKRLRIEGHTDSRGNDKDNLKLSQARAESVRTYLAGKGVVEGRLTAVGYGETRPLVKEKSEADRAKNRRVDFFVVDPETDGIPAPAPTQLPPRK